MTGEIQIADDHLFVFVDTNLFLHFTFFKDVDWCKELNARAVTLVLAPVVLDELDDKKREGPRRDRERAKTVLRAIASLNLAAGPAALRPGVMIEALDEEPDDAFLAQHRLNARNGDDRLLATVLAFSAARSVRAVILSDDTGLGIRGPRRGVIVLAPDESLRLPDEPDETQRELETIRRENIALKSAAPKLRVRFEEGGHLELTTALSTPLEPPIRRALLDQWRARHPHVIGQSDKIKLPGGQEIDVSGMLAYQGVRSRADAAGRNAEIDAAYAEYETYLDNWSTQVNGYRRCIEIRLVLENTGSAFANDVHLTLRTATPGIWRENLPKIEHPPEPPRERSLYDMISPRLPDLDLPDIQRRDAPIEGPVIDEDDPSHASYSVRRVKHHVPCELPVVYFQFESDSDLASFAIDYQLVAAETRTPQDGQLHVRLTLEPPVAPPAPDAVFRQTDTDNDE